MDNYKSSVDPGVGTKVEKAITLNELELGHYVTVNEKLQLLVH